MGIKGFNKFMKQNVPQAFKKVAMSKLQGKRVAIDAHYLLHQYAAPIIGDVSQKLNLRIDPSERNEHEITRRLMEAMIIFTRKLLSRNITPVFIFDGPDKPGKDVERKRRYEDREQNNQEIRELTEKLLQLPTLSRADHDIDRIKKLLSKTVTISKDTISELRTLLQSIGILQLSAIGEGEKLCAQLTVEGYVSAICSKDTDCIVLGSPNMITNFDWTNNTFEITDYTVILPALKIDKKQFIDLCIMSGCDYNKNIPGIAINKSYKLIKQYGSIDNLPSRYDISILNHQECRRNFTLLSVEQLIIPDCPFNTLKLQFSPSLKDARCEKIFSYYELGLLRLEMMASISDIVSTGGRVYFHDNTQVRTLKKVRKY